MKDSLQDEMQAYLDNPESSLQDEMDQYIEEERAKKNSALFEGNYPNTIEGKYLQPIYDIAEPVGKGLSILEKPVSLSMGAGRSIGKLISGQENPSGPILEELGSVFPTPAGSLTADLTEAGIGSEPILGKVLPNTVKEEFPKASSTIEGISPNNIADMVASTAYGATIPGIASAEHANSLKQGLKNAKTALIRGSEKDIKYVGELQSSGKLDTLAEKVVQDKLIRRNINNPEKMVEYLQGVSREVTDPITKKRTRQMVLPGKLDEVGTELGNKIKSLSSKTKNNPVDVDMFVKDMVNDIIDETNAIGSGSDFTPAQIKLEIEKYVKQPRGIEEFHIDTPASIDVSDLVKIKRGAADKLYDIKSISADLDSKNLSKTVADKLWKKADDEIANFAKSVGDYSVMDLNNNYSDYQKIRELYANKDIAAKHIPTLLEDLIPMSAVGTGVGLATGSPYMGAMAAMGYPMARKTVGSMAEKTPSIILGGRLGMVNPALETISKVNPIVSGAMMTRLPMSAKSAMQDPEVVYSKILRDFGPDQAEMFRNARSEDEVRAIFRLLNQQNPSAFEQTKYNNIDGYIDPIYKQKAINDIMIDKETPSHINADKMQGILHEGKIQQ